MGQFLSDLEEPLVAAPRPVQQQSEKVTLLDSILIDMENNPSENPLTLADQVLMKRKKLGLVKELCLETPPCPEVTGSGVPRLVKQKRLELFGTPEPTSKTARLDNKNHQNKSKMNSVEHHGQRGAVLKDSWMKDEKSTVKMRSRSLPRQETSNTAVSRPATYQLRRPATLKPSPSDGQLTWAAKAKVDSRPRKKTAKGQDAAAELRTPSRVRKVLDKRAAEEENVWIQDQDKKYGIKPALAKEKALNDETRSLHREKMSRQQSTNGSVLRRRSVEIRRDFLMTSNRKRLNDRN
jgi:hypothetical protein